MHIGDFGTEPVEADPITFGYFGETIRVNPTLSELDYLDFMEQAGALEVADSAAATTIKGFARACIHPDDFDRFWNAARNNRQGVTDVFTLLGQIVEAMTDRPTGRSSGSAGGQPTDGTRSADDFSRAMRRYEGRPDLQLAIVRAQEAQAG
jgi:hypothetical protein